MGLRGDVPRSTEQQAAGVEGLQGRCQLPLGCSSGLVGQTELTPHVLWPFQPTAEREHVHVLLLALRSPVPPTDRDLRAPARPPAPAVCRAPGPGHGALDTRDGAVLTRLPQSPRPVPSLCPIQPGPLLHGTPSRPGTRAGAPVLQGPLPPAPNSLGPSALYGLLSCLQPSTPSPLAAREPDKDPRMNGLSEPSRRENKSPWRRETPERGAGTGGGQYRD